MRYYWQKAAAIVTLSTIMIVAGAEHFRSPSPFVAIVPKFLPHPRLLVSVSGFFEILVAVGLLIPFTRKASSVGLIALFAAVFPANINMAVNDIPIDGRHFSPWLLWSRLPIQAVLIVWAWWCGYGRAKSDRDEGIQPSREE